MLGNLAGYHSALGEREEAATTSNRAASVLYDLYSDDPEPFQADLLRMLRTTADHLTAIGRFDFAAEAAKLRADVIEVGGGRGVELAEALADLGGSLIGLARFDAAAQVFERAEAMCQDMGSPPPCTRSSSTGSPGAASNSAGPRRPCGWPVAASDSLSRSRPTTRALTCPNLPNCWTTSAAICRSAAVRWRLWKRQAARSVFGNG